MSETKTNEETKTVRFSIRYNAEQKLMSIKNMKEALKKNGITVPPKIDKWDLRELFKSHNLKINENDLEEEIAKEVAKAAEAEEKAKAKAKAAEAEAKAKAKAESKAKAKAKADAVAEAEAEEKPLTEPKEEVVLTLNIKAHGDESTEFPQSSPISKYYKNNVRVHSMACVPGTLAYSYVDDRYSEVEGTYHIFNQKNECATEEIMKEYSAAKKDGYKQMLHHELEKDEDPESRCAYENRERSANFTTYLSKKSFTFENSRLQNEHMKKLSELEAKKFMESWGVNVSDIRLKITNIDGSVRYRQIFNPSHERRKHVSDPDKSFDIRQFNLIYRKGIEFILNVLHKEEFIPSVLQIFKFKDGQDRISEINLQQLYEFFKIVGIKFVNVLDASCRYFPPKFQMTGEKAEKLYLKEQSFNEKPEGFGKRSGTKRSGTKRSGSKRSNRKRSGSNRSGSKRSNRKRSGTKRLKSIKLNRKT